MAWNERQNCDDDRQVENAEATFSAHHLKGMDCMFLEKLLFISVQKTIENKRNNHQDIARELFALNKKQFTKVD